LGLVVLSLVAVRQWQRATDALANREQEHARRAVAQVESLLSADPRAVPTILDSLSGQRSDVLPQLREVWAGASAPSSRPRRMRAELALLPDEPDLVRDELVKWMLEVADAAELLLVRDAMKEGAPVAPAELWQQVSQGDQNPQRRLRLLAALAALDPKGA